jgi:translation initiation factor 5B
MPIRQPIVSVLGHVDHGKTSLLDRIRQTDLALREPGRITQHIGATEVPIKTIYDICGALMEGRDFTLPGLLFIDTPGHQAFTTLRSRGGALADIAVVVVDVTEGFMPQTIESISILRREKRPFVIALNKIDRVQGWAKHDGLPFITSYDLQIPQVREELDDMVYRTIERLYSMGIPSERYDRISDFTTAVALVPISARTGEGLPDLLLILVGLSQRYLQDRLGFEAEGPARGTVLEVKDVQGLGKTIDAIIYDGVLRTGDRIVVGGMSHPIVTQVKALLKPRPLDEIRDPKNRFAAIKEVMAATGVKISGPDLDDALAGSPLIAFSDDPSAAIEEVEKASRPQVETEEKGVTVLADAVGSLEGLAFELKAAKVPIRRAEIRNVSRKDIVEVGTKADPMERCILAFNVDVLPDAQEELTKVDVVLLQGDIIYKLVEDHQAWAERKMKEIDATRRHDYIHPGKFVILPDHIFRVSKPAIVGVRVLAGHLRVGQPIIRPDGRELGKIRSIRSDEETLREVIQGAEVAIAITEVTVGRQIHAGDVLYVDVPEGDARALNQSTDLSTDDRVVLEELLDIRRKTDPFWAM